jgi:hypothetical protein
MRRLVKANNKKSFTYKLKKAINEKNLIKLNMSEPTEQNLKNFQLALSMVGVSANLMTCELIKAISERCDELGEDFSLREANKLATAISMKYGQQIPGMPQGMKPPAPGSVPKEIQDMIDKGQIMMGKKHESEDPIIPPAE